MVCVLPREHSHLPLPTLDASRVVSRTGAAALHTTFEFEVEAGRDITELFLRPDGNPLKLAQSLCDICGTACAASCQQLSSNLPSGAS